MKESYIIIDWQNEEDVQVLRDKKGNTFRTDSYAEATTRLVEEANYTENYYLQISKLG